MASLTSARVVVAKFGQMLRSFQRNLGVNATLMLMSHRDRVAIAVHDSTPPSDEEWARWLTYYIERPNLRDPRALIESYSGAGPNAKQRKLLADSTRGIDVRAAIFTDSLVVRGIVTAIAWLGIPQRAYPRDHFKQAAEFLELTAEEYAWASGELAILRAQLQQPQHSSTTHQHD